MDDPRPPVQMEPRHWRMVQDILRRLVPEATVWAFGSRATGTAKPHSDLDLAIVAPRPLGLAREAALREAFEESDLPFRVDVVDWCGLPSGLQERILRQHIPVHGTATPEDIGSTVEESA